MPEAAATSALEALIAPIVPTLGSGLVWLLAVKRFATSVRNVAP